MSSILVNSRFIELLVLKRFGEIQKVLRMEKDARHWKTRQFINKTLVRRGDAPREQYFVDDDTGQLKSFRKNKTWKVRFCLCLCLCFCCTRTCTCNKQR